MTMNNSTKHKAIHETAEHAITDYQELNDLELEEVAGGRKKRCHWIRLKDGRWMLSCKNIQIIFGLSESFV